MIRPARNVYKWMSKAPVLTLSIVGLVVSAETVLEVLRGSITAGPSFGPLRFRGQPFESLAIVWLLVAIAVERAPRSDVMTERFRVYRLVWSALGLAMVVWAVVVGRTTRVPAQYYAIEATIVGIFVYAAVSNDSAIPSVLRFAWTDFCGFAGRLATWTAVVSAFGVLAFGPREVDAENIPSGPDFEAWFLAQPRVPFPRAPDRPGVQVAEFIDYQCPVSKARDARYQKLFTDLRSTYGDALQIVRYDFPLERECNESQGMRDVHAAACEAAAAVRMARQSGTEARIQDWLWRNQDRLSRDLIFHHVRSVLGIDPASRYPDILASVKADAAVGAALSIKSTPTLWVNGVLVSGVSARSLRWAILHELKQAGVTTAATRSE